MAQITKPVTFRVTPEFHKKLKVFLADRGITIQEYMTKLVEQDMKENAKRGTK